MAKDCIICGARAGSGEHIFPAALGGRRINNGIYCAKHNEEFGKHASTLSRQLEVINAFLSIRSVHSNTARKFHLLDPNTGNELTLSGSTVELTKPKTVTEAILGNRRRAHMQFSDERQFRDWLLAQKVAGHKVEILSSTKQQRFLPQPIPIHLELGGIEGLRAIAYVALTFLAHHYPKHARDPALKEFKEYISGKNNIEAAWWEQFEPITGFVETPFRFGHRILLGASVESKVLYARVSLFSTLDFAVRFSDFEALTSETCITDIDPHAEKMPDDLQIQHVPSALAVVKTPESLTENLRETIVSGKGQERLNQLFQRISAYRVEKDASDLLPKINAIRNIPSPERYRHVYELLKIQQQRILLMMQFIINGVRQQLISNQVPEEIIRSLDLLVEPDLNSPNGLSRTATAALELSTSALSSHICKLLETSDMNLSQLAELLFAGPGLAIVGKTILQPFKMALGIDDSKI